VCVETGDKLEPAIRNFRQNLFLCGEEAPTTFLKDYFNTILGLSLVAVDAGLLA